MHSNSQIQYRTHKELDKVKWDNAIAASSNALIYGCSFYLDHMARHWDALVLNDYEAVMPLTWNRKYGICYLYQPFLCASLGIFGKNVSKKITAAFLACIPDKFRYIDISLNHGNLYTLEDWSLYERKNYVLPLSQPYEALYSRYSENIKRNIKKATQSGCIVQQPSFTEVLQLAKQQLEQFAAVRNDELERFSRLFHYLEQQNATATYGIASADGRLLSSCLFLFWQKRAYYILVGNHAAGRETGASHALIDAFIKDHADKDLVLDFEGSDEPGLALFYRSFGAEEENYPALRQDRLPLLIRWLKQRL